MTFAVGGERLALSELLIRIAARIEQPTGSVDSDTARMTDAVLGGGLPALLSTTSDDPTWLQYGVTFSADGHTKLYQALLEEAERLLQDGDAQEFFFMHKPPGLRLRFQVPTEFRPILDKRVCARITGWCDAGVASAWERAVYEPESHLFGGPTSMRSVHRIFTIDSLAWLAFHSKAQAPAPSWALSLHMIRALFDGLRISGWEDIDVWDRLRWQAGRRLDGGLIAETTNRLAASIQGAWGDKDRLLALLGPETCDIAERHEAAVAKVCRDWQAEYFSAPHAYIGPREAAAFVIVFHWNRARLSGVRQAAIAEALAVRPGTY